MDAERYRSAHSQLLGTDAAFWARDRVEHVCELWTKLMHAYIIPYAPREVNLPGPVRDHLLGLPCSSIPPDPSKLDEAVRIVYELMNDSVLVPFIESVAPPPIEAQPEEEVQDFREGRARIKAPKDSSSPSDDSSRSPKFLPVLGLGRAAGRSATSSAEMADRDGLTDDSSTSANSPPAAEPMTPPTTPPTSDWSFSTSPGGLQRALAAHNNGWRKVGAKLGLSKRGRPADRRSNQILPSTAPATESTTAPAPIDADVTMSETSNSGPL